MSGGRKGRLVTEAAPLAGAASGRSRAEPSPAAAAGVMAASVIRNVLQATHVTDPVALQDQLDAAAADLGLARSIDEIVMPGMQELRRSPATALRDAPEGR